MRARKPVALSTAVCHSGCYKVYDKRIRRWVCVRCGN